MPSLSISDGKERIVASKFETLRTFEVNAIFGAFERMEADANKKAEIKQARELLLKVIREYGAPHLAEDGYPKETSKQATANKV